MNARSFLEKHGRTVAAAVARAAGTNYAYYSQIAYGHRRPSTDLAHELVAASAKRFPRRADQLDFAALLPPKRNTE